MLLICLRVGQRLEGRRRLEKQCSWALFSGAMFPLWDLKVTWLEEGKSKRKSKIYALRAKRRFSQYRPNDSLILPLYEDHTSLNRAVYNMIQAHEEKDEKKKNTGDFRGKCTIGLSTAARRSVFRT